MNKITVPELCAPDPNRDPVTIIALGRGRVGKTTVINVLIQYFRILHADVRIWNGDRQNESQSIARLHTDAVSSPADDVESTGEWLEQRLQEQSLGRFDAVLDLAGGDATIKRLAKEVGLVETMESMRIRPVALHVIGAEPADLDYLTQVSAGSLFTPEATIIVLNNGLFGTDRASDQASDRVMRHPTVVTAVSNGAVIARMPSLKCMAAVRERGLSFESAAAPGATDLSFFDQARTRIWWERDIPTFIEKIPAAWQPRCNLAPADA